MRFRSALVLPLGLVLCAQRAPSTRPVTTRPVTTIPVTEAYLDDPALVKLIAPLKAEIQSTFGLVIAQCPGGLFRGGEDKENELGFWIADAMRGRAAREIGAPVKFGFTNSDGNRADLHPGPLKIGDIYEVMPFDNELVTAELSGAEVIEMVKEMLLHQSLEPISGVIVKTTGTVEQPGLSITWSDGSAIDPKEVVKLATSDYLLANIALLRKSRNPLATGVSMHQMLIDVCISMEAQHKPVVAPALGRMAIDRQILAALKAEPTDTNAK